MLLIVLQNQQVASVGELSWDPLPALLELVVAVEPDHVVTAVAELLGVVLQNLPHQAERLAASLPGAAAVRLGMAYLQVVEPEG